MFIFFKIMLLIVIILLLIIIINLIVPISYKFNSSVDEDIKTNGLIKVLFGFFRVEVVGENTKFKVNLYILKKVVNEEKKVHKEKIHKVKEKKKEKNLSLSIISDLVSYSKEIINIIKPNIFKVKGIYGFSDPFITGIISGTMPIIQGIVPSSDICLTPLFDEEVININIDIYGKAIPGLILIKTIRFVLKKDVRKVLFKR